MKLHLVKIAFAAALVAIACSGCVYTHVPGQFTRISIGTGHSIGRVEFPTKEGVAKIEGYTSEQAQVASAVVEAAIKASASAVKP